MQLNTKGIVPRVSHQPRLSLCGTIAVPASNKNGIAPSQPFLWLLDGELLGRNLQDLLGLTYFFK